MTRPTKSMVNCTTGEQSVVELTDAEIAQLEINRIAFEAQEAAAQAAATALAALKASAKAKLVAGTPLTEEEAATIVL
jgi:hypothetical protein